MSNFLQFCPQDLFNGGQSKDGVCQIQQAYLRIVGPAVDNALIPAVAGKKLRIISYAVTEVSGVGTAIIEFKSKPAGVGVIIYPSMLLATKEKIISNENVTGWFDTVTGEGLTFGSAVAAGGAADVFVKYIEFTP